MVRGKLEHTCLLFLYEMYDMKRSRKFEDRWRLSWTIPKVIYESFSKTSFLDPFCSNDFLLTN